MKILTYKLQVLKQKHSEELQKKDDEVHNLQNKLDQAKEDDNKSKVKLEDEIKKISSKTDEILKSNDQLKEKYDEVKGKYEEVKMKYEKEVAKKGTQETQDTAERIPFEGGKLIHLDLKGAAPKFKYLLEFAETCKKLGATGLLVEYEDMFPWSADLEILARKDAYTTEQLKEFLKKASTLKLEVVPLVQTFGHLEFVLKHDKYKDLRARKDVSTSICPLDKRSVPLVKKMVDQIIDSHPELKWIHLGGDEVWNIKECDECHGNYTDLQLFNRHMIPIMEHVKSKENKKLTPIIWDDMMRTWNVSDMKIMGKYVVPMVWGYVADLSTYKSYPDGMWDRYLEAFPQIFFASSFKGALKPWSNFVPIQQHLDNHLSWLKIFKRYKKAGKKVEGIALTGWSRFDHFGPLCELLPAGVPSMALCLAILDYGGFDGTVHWKASESLGFPRNMATNMKWFKYYTPENGTFERHEIYTMVGELEKASRWKEWAEVRLTGWARPYNVKKKEFSFFQLNDARKGLVESLNGLTKVETKGRELLSEIFNKDTVDEWMEEKVEILVKDVKEKLKVIDNHIKDHF